MSINRWDPMRDVLSLREAMERVFQESVLRPTSALMSGGAGLALDLAETPDSFVVRASLPGVRPEDVQVTAHGDTLTIRGETRGEEEQEGHNWIMRERRSGVFQRSITLPAPVHADQAEAHYEHGLLEVRLPKAEEAKVKLISVAGQGTPAGQRVAGGASSGTSGQPGSQAQSQSQPGAGAGGTAGPDERDAQTRAGGSAASPSGTAQAQEQKAGEKDVVTQESIDSFPASDPPSWTPERTGAPRPPGS